MKKLILFTVLLLAASVGYCQNQPLQRFDKSSPLTLTIKSDKEVYEVGESLNIWSILKNVSNQAIWVNTREEYTFIPHIIDIGEGNIINAEVIGKATLRAFTKDDFISLLPNREVTTQVIKDGEFIKGSVVGKFNLKKGIYNISLEYENIPYKKTHPWEPDLSGGEFGIKAWTGTLTSNTITIEVKEKK